MTANARKALHDLKIVHGMLEDETDKHRFRVLWVSAISLARAIGHVLEKVDGRLSEPMKKAADAAFKNWKSGLDEHKIFLGFIESERNTLLKEYEFGCLSGPLEITVTLDGNDETFSVDSDLFSPLSYGPFAGEDCRNVLSMAIDWWDSELTKSERSLPSNHSLQGRRP